MNLRLVGIILFALLIPIQLTKAQTIEQSSLPHPSEFWSNNWQPEKLKNSIGIETSATTLGVLGRNVLVYSRWLNSRWGIEGLFGFSKASDTMNTAVNSSTDAIANSQTTTTTYTGVEQPKVITLGAVVKNRIYQSSWLQVYIGGMVAVNHFSDTRYQTGSSAATITDLATPNNFTVTETNLGTISTSQEIAYIVGPRVGTEIYLKWFPNFALGFSGGILYFMGGEQTTTTQRSTRSFAVVSGVPQEPTTTSTSTNIVSRTRPPNTINTFGIGGTSFSFNGLWTIKYMW